MHISCSDAQNEAIVVFNRITKSKEAQKQKGLTLEWPFISCCCTTVQTLQQSQGSRNGALKPQHKNPTSVLSQWMIIYCQMEQALLHLRLLGAVVPSA